LAGVTVMHSTLRPVAHGPEGRPEFPAGAKIVAIATIVIWIGVVFFGRAIAYDGAVWGTG
jgi:hypothetical protein